MAQHASKLRDVREGNSVRLETTDGLTLEAECTTYQKQSAAAGSGHIRETRLWVFQEQESDQEYAAAILDGLASTEEEQGKFPKHNQLIRQDDDFTEVGFIESMEILGPAIES